MKTTDRRVLELALLGLQAEQRRINDELADIRARLGQAPSTSRQQSTASPTAPQHTAAVGRSAPNKGRKMSAAQKRKISLAMKARYAAKKKAT